MSFEVTTAGEGLASIRSGCQLAQGRDTGLGGGMGREHAEDACDAAAQGVDDEEVGRCRAGEFVGATLRPGLQLLERIGERLRIPGELRTGFVGAILAGAADAELEQEREEGRDEDPGKGGERRAAWGWSKVSYAASANPRIRS